MPYKLIEIRGSDLSKKAYILNTQTGKHFSKHPIPLENAKAQLRLLEHLESRNK
jgi:hypothetical protein